MSTPVNCTDSELSTYLLGLAGGYFPTCSSDISQSAPLKSNPIASKSYTLGRKTVSFPGFPSLQMSKSLTESRGAELPMSSAVDSHARTSAPQEKAQESTASEADFGEKWPASFARFDPASRSWKTPQCSLLAGLDEFSETWPQWGMMQNGACSALTMLGLPTVESESGFWPTPTTSPDAPNTNANRKCGPNSLSEAAKLGRPTWPTPRAGNPGSRPNGKGGKVLAEEVKKSMWPTPTCDDASNVNPKENRFRGLVASVNETTKTQMFPTPIASEARCGFQNRTNGKKGTQKSLTTIVQDGPAAEVGGALNPTWVEWLMGWPLFWTTLDMDAKHYYDCWHETQQRAQAGTEEIQGGIMRNVWWNIDPSEAPQGRESNEQYQAERDDCLPAVPCENSLPDRELGDWQCEAGGVQDLRNHVQAKENEEIQTLRKVGMPERKREVVGRTAMGVKNRVDRLKAIGNGQVPSVAALAWRILSEGII